MSSSAALSSFRKFYRGLGFADVLSISRGLAAVPVVWLGLTGHLAEAAICFIIGQVTDLFDGVVARRRGALQDIFPNLDLDGINDAILGFAATGFIGWWVITHHTTPLVIGLVVGIYVATALLGGYMALVSMNVMFPTACDRMVIRINMLIGHAGIHIGGATLWFVYFGLGYALIPSTAIILGLVGLINHKKLSLWKQGRVK